MDSKITIQPGLLYRGRVKDDLDKALELRKLIHTPMDGCRVVMVPRADTEIGEAIAHFLAEVPPYPEIPVDFGFDERPILQNHAVFDNTMTGFPYMKVERYDGGETKLLVFRLPPNIGTISNPPAGLTALSLDDYAAIAGTETEKAPPAGRPVTHAFRVEGEAYDLLSQFDADYKHYLEKDAAIRDKILSLIQTAAPGTVFDKYAMDTQKWWKDSPRKISLCLPQAALEKARALLLDHFKIASESRPIGYRQDRIELTLAPQTETENGKAMARAIDDSPFEPRIGKLYSHFGFDSKDGRDQMIIYMLEGMKECTVMYYLPPYIDDVKAPEGTIALSREEFITICADSWDINAGSPPPPRPEHLRHLPMPEGAERMKRVNTLKDEKNDSGLPLHQRTEFNWFLK